MNSSQKTVSDTWFAEIGVATIVIGDANNLYSRILKQKNWVPEKWEAPMFHVSQW